MNSPPSSPLGQEISPPSSPIPESPAKKRRSWQVYRIRDGETSTTQLPRSTSWRWRQRGVEERNECDVTQTMQTLQDDEQSDIHGTADMEFAEPVRDEGDDEQSEIHGAADMERAEPVTDEREHQHSEFMRSNSFGSETSGEIEYVTDVCSDFSEDSLSDQSSVPSDTEFIESCQESEVNSECDGNVSDTSSNSSDTQSLCSDEEDELIPLYDNCEFSVDEAILDILTNHVTNHGTINSLKSNLKTFLKYISKPNAMPKNVYKLFNYVLKLAPSYNETVHHYCSKCFLYADNSNDPCRACESTGFNRFYFFSLEEQLRFYFEECNLADILDKYHDVMHSTDGKIRDITDGSEYLRVRLDGRYNLTLLMNTDGVSIRKSAHTSIWPVMFSICEIPSYLRQKFMVVSGIWCDQAEPPMNTFLKPVVKELQDLYQKGGVAWVHPETKVQQVSLVLCPVICADAPARAKVQNILSHGGKTSCNTCEQKTRRIALTPAEANLKAAGKKVKRKRAFSYEEIPAPLRTDARMRAQARRAANLPPGKTVKGVKGPARVGLIPKLDMSTCVYAEYMHGVCLGVSRSFLTLWLTVPGPWNISQKQGEIDEFLKNISPTSDIGRLSRGTKDLKYWKASELRAWLLYYSLPCLSGKLPPAYLQHWTLLVTAIFLLLQEEISERDLLMAEVMLKIFVRDIAHLYRLRDYLYNVHQLIHLPLYVRRWGNLWSTSAFKFENYNGILVHLIHGTKNPAKELVNNLRIAHGLEILRIKVHGKFMASTQKLFQPLNSRPCNSPNVPDDVSDFMKINFPGINQIYVRGISKNTIFTSKLYGREQKRNNYTVKFKSASVSGYGEIKYFFVKEDGNICAVLDKFRIIHTAMFSHNDSGTRVNHIVAIERDPCDLNVVVNVESIAAKVLRVGNYVCSLPNKYEKHNL